MRYKEYYARDDGKKYSRVRCWFLDVATFEKKGHDETRLTNAHGFGLMF